MLPTTSLFIVNAESVIRSTKTCVYIHSDCKCDAPISAGGAGSEDSAKAKHILELIHYNLNLLITYQNCGKSG